MILVMQRTIYFAKMVDEFVLEFSFHLMDVNLKGPLLWLVGLDVL